MSKKRESLFELPRQTKNDPEQKLIGASVPRSIADKVYLYALHQKEPISAIIRNFAGVIANNVDEELITKKLAEEAFEVWQKRVEKNKEAPKWKTDKQLEKRFQEFNREMEERLQKRKISAKYISMIEQKFHQFARMELHQKESK